VLLAIEGQPVEQTFAQAFALQSPRPPNWQAGNRVEYTILRDGREVTLDVPMDRHFPQVIWNYFSSPMGGVWLSLLTIPAMLAIGLVVFLQRPHYLPAQLLLLFSWSLSSSQLAIAPLSVAMLLDPIALFFAYTPVFIRIWQLTILPVIVHLLLVFPVPKQPLRRHPRLILLVLYWACLRMIATVRQSAAASPPQSWEPSQSDNGSRPRPQPVHTCGDCW
jgi:hypothetical protein